MNSILENYGLPTRDEIVSALQWAQDALQSGAIPDDDLYLVLVGSFAQTTQATATRLMEVKRQPAMDLLPAAEMAKVIGTTTKNLRQHKTQIKGFLKGKGLRSHINAADRKLKTGKAGRHSDGFTAEEIRAVAQRVQDLGTLTLAFPITVSLTPR